MGDHNRDEESQKLVWFAFFEAWKKLSWIITTFYIAHHISSIFAINEVK
jgi:hypothetical protein